MSKNLENEYKEMMQNEIPDLWSRIEDNLEPKKSKKQVLFFQRINVRYYAGIAACLALLCIAVPLVKLSMNSEKNVKDKTAPITLNVDGVETELNESSSEGFDTKKTEIQLDTASSSTDNVVTIQTQDTSLQAQTENTTDAQLDTFPMEEAGETESPEISAEEVQSENTDSDSEDEEEDAGDYEDYAGYDNKNSFSTVNNTQKTESVTLHAITKNSASATISENQVMDKFENIVLMVMSTINDDGDIYYRAKITSDDNSSLPKDSVILLQITDPKVGKLAEKKNYKVSLINDESVDTSGKTVYNVVEIE